MRISAIVAFCRVGLLIYVTLGGKLEGENDVSVEIVSRVDAGVFDGIFQSVSLCIRIIVLPEW